MTRWRVRMMGTPTFRSHGLLNNSILLTYDAQNLQAMLSSKFADFEMGTMRRDNLFPVYGHGIFTSEGPAWHRFRQQLRPQFSRDNVNDLECAEHHLQILFDNLPKEDAKGWLPETDLMPLIFRTVLDVSTEFLFGQSVNSQTSAIKAAAGGASEEAKRNLEFAEALDYAKDYMGWRVRLQSLWWLANNKKFRQAQKTLKEYSSVFVKRVLDPAEKAKRQEKKQGEKERFVLVEALAATNDSHDELRDQCLQVLIAGRDTTAGMVCWAILLLSRHPALFNELRAAIVEKFGTEKKPKEPLSFDGMRSCKLLQYTLLEALRLYPIIPLNSRTALKDTVLPTGGGPDGKQPIAVMKGEQVGYSAYVLQRREELWGDDSDEFRPQRWEGRKTISWDFLGFSLGPRICLGREYFLAINARGPVKLTSITEQYAMNEGSYLLARFLQRFDAFSVPDITAPLVKKLSTNLIPGDGVKISLHRASD